MDFLELVKPQGLKNSVMKNTVNIDWGDVGGAVKYKIYFSFKNNFSTYEAFRSAELFSSKARYSLDDNCRLVYYRVEAIDKNGKSALSDVDVIVPSCTVLSGFVRDKNNSVIKNATITFQIDNNETHNKVVTSDSDGYYIIPIASIAKYLILNVQADGYDSLILQIDKDATERFGYAQKDIILLKADDSIVKFDGGDVLYHLGNDAFSGSVNSQLQIGSSIGLSKTLTFTVREKQLDLFSHVRLNLVIRGAQLDNIITINGSKVGYASSSPSNGSFGAYYWNIEKSLLHVGENNFSLTSASNFWDYDDFEFTNVKLKLYDHEPIANEKGVIHKKMSVTKEERVEDKNPL